MALTALFRSLHPTTADRELARTISAYPAMRGVGPVFSRPARSMASTSTPAGTLPSPRSVPARGEDAVRRPALAGR